MRTNEIAAIAAKITNELFIEDFVKFTFITTDSIIIEQAGILVLKYGLEGLRTLDSIQLATAVSLIKQVDVFVTSDKLLQSFFIAEGLPVQTIAP